jgi:hypothetical protein
MMSDIFGNWERRNTLCTEILLKIE